MKINEKIILIFIVILATTLRIWALGLVPPSPDWDEASLGYNAYSLLQTGRDEYGAFLPVVLRSFDDYKPAGYTYFIIPFIKIFGLNLMSVRLPSVIFGVLAVLATFFLIKELFQDKKWRIKVALVGSFLLAISPWHVQFSRVAFEACTGMAFNLFTVLFFLKGLKNNKFFLLTAIVAALNIHVYQNEKVITPLLVLILSSIYWKQLIKVQKKYLMSAIILGIVIILPFVLYAVMNRSVFARAAGVSAFADITPFLKEDAAKIAIDNKNHDLLGLILDNRRFVFFKTVISGYISHSDINWLFINGDLARHHVPGMGLLYLFELPFLFIGIYSIIFSTYLNRQSKLLIFLWLFIVPLPASITSGVPHAVRTLNFLPILQIFTAVGLIVFLEFILREKKFVYSAIGIICLLLAVVNFIYYLDQYFVQQNYLYSQNWQYGYKETVTEMEKIQNNYEKIIVSNKPYMDQSYIFFLFYLKYPPNKYQLESGNIVSGGFRENHLFGKYEFRPIEWSSEKKNSKTLFIGLPSDFPPNAHVLKNTYFLDGTEAIKIVEG